MAKFKGGQIYHVKGMTSESGNIIKLVGMNNGKCKYQTLRGAYNGAKEFGADSWFAKNNLTLLTGKQIGEAIRKYDADHANRETGVREVKRPAKPGEYIKIVDAVPADGQQYAKGDIFRVTKDHAVFAADVEVDGVPDFIDVKEYVVLEGYKPEKEEHRKARVGDTVRFLSNHGGKVIRGKIGTITYVGGGYENVKVDGKDGFLVYQSHGDYEIISSGKHPYTDAEIANAKKLCGEMIVEAFDGNKTFAFHFYDKQNGGYSGDCEENEVKTDFKSFDGTEATGIAKCSDHDEYNVWIGRCVALCKALHKPIPAFILGDGATRHFDFEKARAKGSNAGYVSIHCAGEKETRELMKELDALGYKWESGNTLPSLYYGDGYFHVKSTKSVVRSDCSTTGDNYVEFSDCFTEG